MRYCYVQETEFSEHFGFISKRGLGVLYHLQNFQPKFPEILPTGTESRLNRSKSSENVSISELFDLIFLAKYSRIILYVRKKVCDIHGTK